MFYSYISGVRLVSANRSEWRLEEKLKVELINRTIKEAE